MTHTVGNVTYLNNSRYLGDVTAVGTYELKVRGHELIDELVMLDVGRNAVYATLAKRLKVRPYRAHFSQMRGRNECERAVLELEKMLVARREKIENRQKRGFYRRNMFTDKAVLREVGERNRRRLEAQRASFWRTLINTVRVRLGW